MPIINVSWFEVQRLVDILHSKLYVHKFVPDYVIGVHRGGVIPASLLQRKTGGELSLITPDQRIPTGIAGNILIVDDVWDSGNTLRNMLDNVWHEDNVMIATLHCKQDITHPNHIYGKHITLKTWINYPWEQGETLNETR